MEALLLLQVLAVIPFWCVFSRVGLARLLSLLILVPLAGWAIVGLILALSQWPAVQPAGHKP